MDHSSIEDEADIMTDLRPGSLVRDWMTPNPRCVTQQASLSEVAAMMRSHKHSCAIVTHDTGVVGLISESDMVRILPELVAGKHRGAVAGDIMSSPIVSIGVDETLDSATQAMGEHRIRRLIALDDKGRLAGILTQSDMTRAHLARIEAHRATLEARVAERTAELEAANEQLEALTRIDPLMNIGNRRAMEEALAMAHQRSLRYQRTYSVILLDVDQFKAYNDNYGHPRGDRVLRDIAREVLGCIRVLDTAYRYGGEEILVLLPETAAEGATAVAERIRRSIAALESEHASSQHGIVTISAGVATSSPATDGSIPGVLDLLDAADRSLYEAKHAGRNRLGTAIQAA